MVSYSIKCGEISLNFSIKRKNKCWKKINKYENIKNEIKFEERAKENRKMKTTKTKIQFNHNFPGYCYSQQKFKAYLCNK